MKQIQTMFINVINHVYVAINYSQSSPPHPTPHHITICTIQHTTKSPTPPLYTDYKFDMGWRRKKEVKRRKNSVAMVIVIGCNALSYYRYSRVSSSDRITVVIFHKRVSAWHYIYETIFRWACDNIVQTVILSIPSAVSVFDVLPIMICSNVMWKHCYLSTNSIYVICST